MDPVVNNRSIRISVLRYAKQTHTNDKLPHISDMENPVKLLVLETIRRFSLCHQRGGVLLGDEATFSVTFVLELVDFPLELRPSGSRMD